MVRDPNYFLSSLPQTYFMHRDGSLLRVMVDTPDNLRHLRTELELLKRVARKSVSWSGVVDAAVTDKYQESDRTELDRILFDAWHPMIDEMIVLFDQEFEDVKEEILLSVVDEEAANIVQEAAECGVLKPVEDLVGTNKTKNPYGASFPSEIEDALAAAEKAMANAAQMNSQEQITEDELVQDSEILDSFKPDLEKTDSVLETATPEAAIELDLSDEQDKPDHTLQFMEQIQELKDVDVDVEDDQAKNEAKDFDLHSSVPQDFSIPEMENHGSQDEFTEPISSEESSDHVIENIENSDVMTPDDHESIDHIPDIRTINPFAATPMPEVVDSEVKADSNANANEPQQVSFELPEPEAMISAALEPTQDENTSDLMNFEIGDPLAAIESLQGSMDQITNDAEVDPLATSADQDQEEDASSEKMLPPASLQDRTDEAVEPEKFILSDPQAMIKDTSPEYAEEKNAVVPTPEELSNMQNIDSDLDDVDET